MIDALLELVNAELDGVTAYPSWPGPDASREMVVLGEIRWEEYELATIKAGRKRRDENWSVEFEVYVLGMAETSPADPNPARDRAFEIFAALENTLADDPKLGLTSVDWVQVTPEEAGPRVMERGWAYRIAGRVHAYARLT